MNELYEGVHSPRGGEFLPRRAAALRGFPAMEKAGRSKVVHPEHPWVAPAMERVVTVPCTTPGHEQGAVYGFVI